MAADRWRFELLSWRVDGGAKRDCRQRMMIGGRKKQLMNGNEQKEINIFRNQLCDKERVRLLVFKHCR